MEFSQPRPAIAIMGFFFFGCDVLLMVIGGVFRGFGESKISCRCDCESPKLEIDKGKCRC